MKAISLHQPWASLIALGAKKIETRSWRTPYRGLLAIHAAKKTGVLTVPYSLAGDKTFAEAIFDAIVSRHRGVIVAVARLVACQWTGDDSPAASGPYPPDWVRLLTKQEQACGDFSAGRYGWILEDVRPLAEPVPCRGQQGIWPLPDDVLAQVDRQIRARVGLEVQG